jgi:hypothetical protein
MIGLRNEDTLTNYAILKKLSSENLCEDAPQSAREEKRRNDDDRPGRESLEK